MFSRILTALAVSALLAGAAQAQPATKLTRHLDDDTIDKIWCSAVFLEESYWYEDDNEWGTYYGDLSIALDEQISAVEEVDAMSDAEWEEMWNVYDDAAYALADTDEDGFLAVRDDCLGVYGNLATRPKS